VTHKDQQSAILFYAKELELLGSELQDLQNKQTQCEKKIAATMAKMRGIFRSEGSQLIAKFDAKTDTEKRTRLRGAPIKQKRVDGTVERMYRSNGYVFLAKRLRVGRVAFVATTNGKSEVVWLNEREYKMVKDASDNRYGKGGE
tara:strand:- start:116 stop:547 length:432 start_codon:yes stop_codon:yes gene_type:complete